MQAGGDLVNLVKQYNEFKLRDKGIGLAVGLMFITDIHSLGPDALAGTHVHRRLVLELRRPEPQPGPTGSRQKTGTRPTFAHAANYSAAMQYLEAVQPPAPTTPTTWSTQLEGKEIDDVFLRNGEIRAEDHRVVHDAYLAQVKPPGEVTEDWDYEKILKTIPAGRGLPSRSPAPARLRMRPGQKRGRILSSNFLQQTFNGLVSGRLLRPAGPRPGGHLRHARGGELRPRRVLHARRVRRVRAAATERWAGSGGAGSWCCSARIFGSCWSGCSSTGSSRLDPLYNFLLTFGSRWSSRTW